MYIAVSLSLFLKPRQASMRSFPPRPRRPGGFPRNLPRPSQRRRSSSFLPPPDQRSYDLDPLLSLLSLPLGGDADLPPSDPLLLPPSPLPPPRAPRLSGETDLDLDRDLE